MLRPFRAYEAAQKIPNLNIEPMPYLALPYPRAQAK